MAAATTIHLIRHATYDLLDRGVLAGRSGGWGLNATGRAQAEALAESLARVPLAAVVASPLERAQETAGPIAARHRLAVETDDGLHEIDFGDWTGTSFAVLHRDPAWVSYNSRRSIAAPPGGETMFTVQIRALQTVLRLAERFPDAAVAAVTHADVIKALLAYALGMPLDLFRRIEIAPASRSVLVLGQTFLRVQGVNLPA